ncbi:heme-binding domain-containing protein [Pedobacter duraquae]|uniref:Cytochrome P460 n=1 Tax=Pedobacter duraquae TaxID=425511 RepID=A0A4R6IMA2_9SPHI|nr:cytochrome P460 family protein [Pedobacter duraquae]TDO23289.1 cytochrome P460 [Pedobacter duraquae]
MKRTLTVIVVLLGIVLGMQLIRPTLLNPPVTGDIKAPMQVKAILKKACYDCHSNETNLRWYDQVAPAYWQVVADVRDGRAGMNFSTWDSLAVSDQKAKLWEAVNQVMAGAMPIKGYTFVHPAAKISSADLQVLKNYVMTLGIHGKPGDTTKINALAKQKIQIDNIQTAPLPMALNGISYIPDYKNWQAISTTERYDNGTMRIIYGNDVAVKAIKEHRVSPWPDGTIFAKVAWDQLEDASGNVTTGVFKQVEYMIKDQRKYASTKGWGFARFKTPEMLPYGKTVNFANECVNCHRPMKNNDFVFTQPIKN